MFGMQVRLMAGGRQVAFDRFIAAVVAEIARRVRAEMQNLPQGPPVVAELPRLQREESERKAPKPLAVGPSQSRSA